MKILFKIGLMIVPVAIIIALNNLGTKLPHFVPDMAKRIPGIDADDILDCCYLPGTVTVEDVEGGSLHVLRHTAEETTTILEVFETGGQIVAMRMVAQGEFSMEAIKLFVRAGSLFYKGSYPVDTAAWIERHLKGGSTVVGPVRFTISQPKEGLRILVIEGV